jgi:hypothetical protein
MIECSSNLKKKFSFLFFSPGLALGVLEIDTTL